MRRLRFTLDGGETGPVRYPLRRFMAAHVAGWAWGRGRRVEHSPAVSGAETASQPVISPAFHEEPARLQRRAYRSVSKTPSCRFRVAPASFLVLRSYLTPNLA